ncbi:MAG: DUF924 family protein [Paracoccaceae bacterium]
MSDPVEVLDFWLGEVGPDGWYAGGEALDGECRDRFGDLVAAARDGALDHWAEGAAGTLAYLVLTDQLPRNIHRGTALAFAADPRARAAARRALDQGWDMQAPEPERQFFYLPFEHSEDPGDQALSLRLFAERMPENPDALLHARAHDWVIRRFGRFPYRNAALDRDTTAQEQAFLDEGGYGAALRAVSDSHAPGA